MSGRGPWRDWLRRKRAGWLVAACSLPVLLLGVAFLLDIRWVPDLRRAETVSTLVTDRDGRALRAFPVENGRWRLPVTLDAVDPDLVSALIAVEDRRFHEHPGVDLLAMARAAANALRSGEIVSGASTLTMQTARLLEPRPERTLWAKLVESVRALQLEWCFSKREILELYLRLAPYGGNLEGVRAASWAWFGREPNHLTPSQIALLLALPQAPEARRPDRHPQAARASRRRMLARMVDSGLISGERAVEAARDPLPTRRHAFPAEAWHASARLQASAQGMSEVRSTLDGGLQQQAQALAQDAARAAGPGVQVALMVVDLEDHAVRAAVGSAERDSVGGWIDLIARPRSPGSVLKPLIYALAFEDGLATAGTRIDDLPRAFGDYAPENFDRRYRGEITVATALQQSLNLPAVELLAAVGPLRYAAALDLAGAPPVLPPGALAQSGLALALGGMGMTLIDVASIYAALGADGQARPLAWTVADAAAHRREPGHTLVSANAARQVLDILQGAPVPHGRMRTVLSGGAPEVAAKTGTSYGFRDAWAAGVSAGHAIVVWVGRPDGAPRPGITGRQAALPLLFDVAEQLAQRAPGSVPVRVRRAQQPAPTQSLARFGDSSPGPEIVFPPDGSELWVDDTEQTLAPAARGREPLRWYQQGQALPLDARGAPLWRPGATGFHELVVVDARGRAARTRVRIRGPQQLAVAPVKPLQRMRATDGS